MTPRDRTLQSFPNAFLRVYTVQELTGPVPRYMLLTVLAVADTEDKVWELAGERVEQLKIIEA